MEGNTPWLLLLLGISSASNDMTVQLMYCDCDVQEGAKDRAHVHMEGNTPWLELLLGISGAFRPKVLTCLMGVTGAGKTTLMDVLAGRKTGKGQVAHVLVGKLV